MLNNKPEYYGKVADELERFLYDNYYAPLLDAINESKIATSVKLVNAVPSALVQAIKAGKVKYDSGIFSGQFNVRISRELSYFAKFDARSTTWKGNPPPEVKAASIIAESKRQELVDKMNRAIQSASDKVQRAINGLSVNNAVPFELMFSDVNDDLRRSGVGVMPEVTKQSLEKLRKDYDYRQRENVKGWTDEQASRLRDMVTKYQTEGTEESLLVLIQREYDVTTNKARFLARQETGLFFESLSRNRALSAGVRRYKWSTSHDSRVRKNPNGPNHKHLDQQIFDLAGEGGVVDLKTGRKAHAGQDFGCRCRKIWILE